MTNSFTYRALYLLSTPAMSGNSHKQIGVYIILEPLPILCGDFIETIVSLQVIYGNNI